jgi:hypothetical protein
MVQRLIVNGSRLLFTDGRTALLRGFNLLFMLDSIFEEPRKDTDDLMLELLPRTNFVRLVMLHWDDKPTKLEGEDSKNDCAETWDQYQPIQRSCLDQIETVLQWTASKGLWAVLTARASLAAGEETDGRELVTVFDDAALRQRFMRMWRAVSQRCRHMDMIAGYEVMSEPRVRKTPAEVVRGFYHEACVVIQREDPRAPCIVGAAPYYNLHGLEGALMPGLPNVVYAFNFFVPRKYVNGLDPSYKYPGPMRCCDAHEKEHSRCCPGHEGEDLSKLPCCDSMLQVDKQFLQEEFDVAMAFRDRHNVPIYMDQWAISRKSGPGRMRYVADVLNLLEESGTPWTYWQWRQRDYSSMTVVQMNADWDDPWYDDDLLGELSNVLGKDALMSDPSPPPRSKSFHPPLPQLATTLPLPHLHAPSMSSPPSPAIPTLASPNPSLPLVSSPRIAPSVSIVQTRTHDSLHASFPPVVKDQATPISFSSPDQSTQAVATRLGSNGAFSSSTSYLAIVVVASVTICAFAYLCCTAAVAKGLLRVGLRGALAASSEQSSVAADNRAGGLRKGARHLQRHFVRGHRSRKQYTPVIDCAGDADCNDSVGDCGGDRDEGDLDVNHNDCIHGGGPCDDDSHDVEHDGRGHFASYAASARVTDEVKSCQPGGGLMQHSLD